MAIQSGGLAFDLIPNFGGLSLGSNAPSISSIVNIGLWGFIIIATIFILLKFGTHRIFVELLENVRGGYVVKGGRYRIRFDKKNSMEYLEPMFGSERLPNFPTAAYQKVKGVAIIGVQREISVIKLNKYSFKVSLPPENGEDRGIIKYYNTLTWVFLEQRRQFLRKLVNNRTMHYLAILAPSVIILFSFIILAWAIYIHARMDANYAAFLNEQIKIVTAAMNK